MTGFCRLAIAAAAVAGGLSLLAAGPATAQAQQPAGTMDSQGGSKMMMHGQDHMKGQKMHGAAGERKARQASTADAGASVSETNQATQMLNQQQLDRLQASGSGMGGTQPSGSGTSGGMTPRTQ